MIFFPKYKSLTERIKSLGTKPAEYWEQLGERYVLSLYRYAAQNIPAYRSFLESHKMGKSDPKDRRGFSRLPFTSKHTYVNIYPFHELVPRKELKHLVTFSATSGSSGEPTYFPRTLRNDEQYEYILELIFRNQFRNASKKILCILGFGMGIWIGGIFTYRVLTRMAEKGHKLGIIPSGPNIKLFLTSLRTFGYLYDEIILMGYPPFIKDVVDEAQSEGVDWTQYSVKILTAAEGFSEEFRAYISRTVCLADARKDFVNIYGTVELGTMAHETTIANTIRKIASQRTDVSRALFGSSSRIPTLCQYHPYLTYFEQIGDEVVASGYGSGIPLLRYRFPDQGGVIPFDAMMRVLSDFDIDIYKELKDGNLDKAVLRLPFVYVFERADHTLTVRGVNIYPDHIKRALAADEVASDVTGKFTMVKSISKKMDEFFHVHVELKKGIRITKQAEEKIKKTIITTLKSINSEFADQYAHVGNRIAPKITLWLYKSQTMFQSPGKHKWTLH